MLRSTSMKCTTILNVVSNVRDKICWTCQLAYMCTHIEYVVKKAKHLCMASYAVHSGVLRKLCPSYLLHHSGTNLKLNLAEWNTMCLTFDFRVNPPFFSLWAVGDALCILAFFTFCWGVVLPVQVLFRHVYNSADTLKMVYFRIISVQIIFPM